MLQVFLNRNSQLLKVARIKVPLHPSPPGTQSTERLCPNCSIGNVNLDKNHIHNMDEKPTDPFGKHLAVRFGFHPWQTAGKRPLIPKVKRVQPTLFQIVLRFEETLHYAVNWKKKFCTKSSFPGKCSVAAEFERVLTAVSFEHCFQGFFIVLDF